MHSEALDGGMMALHITAACHPNETVQISYAGAEFLRQRIFEPLDMKRTRANDPVAVLPGRSAGYAVRRIDLARLDFDPILHGGFRRDQMEEPDLVQARKTLAWADHQVWIWPVWYGSAPALAKCQARRAGSMSRPAARSASSASPAAR